MSDKLQTWTAHILLLLALAHIGRAEIVNSKIDRIIDLSSHLVKIVDRFHLETEVETYQIKIDPSHKPKLAFIEATMNNQVIRFVEKSDGSYEANLAGQSNKQPLVVTTVYSKLLQPYPVEIKQNERQLVSFEGAQAPISPYLTKTATTRIKLPPGSRLESFTKGTKMTTGTNKLTYGPFKDLAANQAEPLKIHFENNSPFVTVANLDRSVSVSPWRGAIDVVNAVSVQHHGSKMKGPFKRLHYQRDPSDGMSSVRSLLAELPRSASNIYFRDGIGNISTSTIRTTSTSTVVGLKPRFPLFGGWVATFSLGYIVPKGEFINEPVTGNNFRLSIPFADTICENMFIDDATVKIYLPAGASNIEVRDSTLLDFERLPDDVSYSYLDIVGRPVVVLRKRNIVPQHLEGRPLVIRFNYSKIYMLQEPFLLLAALIGAVLLAVIYSKLTPKSIATPPSKLKGE